jgi:hypothetical protein
LRHRVVAARPFQDHGAVIMSDSTDPRDAKSPASPAAADFYRCLPILGSFGDLADRARYRPLPEDWFVGAADIVGSTVHIEAGRYKMVNTIGVAVISAQINSAGGEPFPYVFGGDGASFAFAGDHLERSREALARVMRWAFDEFGVEMRGAIVPIADIRAVGFDVAVARYRASENTDYAMFDGGGLAWVDRQMKDGRYGVPMASADELPDLSGLSCRWLPMRSKNGKVLSILAIPLPGAPPAKVATVMHRVIDLTRRLERSGHPVPVEGPSYSWPPEGLALEAHALHGRSSLLWHKIRLLLGTFFAWFLFKTRLHAGRFDPTRYLMTTAENADFRKFDDGLKMTLDCDAGTRRRLEAILRSAADAGIITYGLFEQDEAIITCIVPSVTSDNHIHFVDGAAGGYTIASIAAKMPYQPEKGHSADSVPIRR